MIWDKLSPFYDLFENLYNGKCNRGIAEEITKYINDSDIVLECACGTGLLTVPMAEKCKKLVATDYSAGMLRQVKKKLVKFENVRIRKASIYEIPFADNRFDVVVAANVIHLLEEPKSAIAEMQRVCRPGGRIIIPTYINASKNEAKFAEKLLGVIGVDFKKEFNLDTYKEFFTTQGVMVKEYIVIDGRMPCAFAIIEN